ncbi:MAG: Triosephosphate isomerase [Candidatus Magasanikbacteria bacterium GW2011_GWA2_40_10]|uniref:Triosephosphate isomerase n=1 Tax=Candidatus Magasanikbacteria bacterium GW2011_GWA2_40_10 TaxID=1619037 RepID=A0A0G0Q593_9BACT|nr:MAG: Triosephosphate isomerase [Candidatus Magasanikbacteria bacterium GW2011_GWA2_40_10]
MSKKMYLFANWKMYLDYDESNILANAIADKAKGVPKSVKMAIFPSALALYPVGQVLRDAGISVGAQNTYWLDKGGYTGEVSAVMYKEAGCEYALVGHSERRHLFHESNHEVRQKVEAALFAGLTPVICVGETEEERKDGKTEEATEIQIRAAFHNILWPKDRELIVAYEPVWAIGTGDNCYPPEAERMHELIKKQVIALTGVSPVVLYGGSVKPENIAEYLKNPSINGVLVGNASTNLEGWMSIISNIR